MNVKRKFHIEVFYFFNHCRYIPLEKTYQFIKTLNNVKRVEVLPYHTLGIHKYQLLNMPYRLDGVNPPSKERIQNANNILHTKDFKFLY